MNQFPQFMVDVEVDGVACSIHLFHLRGKGPSSQTVALMHGWLGSFVKFLASAGLLAE